MAFRQEEFGRRRYVSDGGPEFRKETLAYWLRNSSRPQLRLSRTIDLSQDVYWRMPPPGGQIMSS